jgi:predicted naringenin-chalcone synthase
MTTAYINRIATALPQHDVHDAFVQFARTLIPEQRARAVFERMADKAQIHHRYSCLAPAAQPDGPSVDAGGFYTRGRFPSTADRMKVFEEAAPDLAFRAVDGLGLGTEIRQITHVIVTSCTGFYAPGIDLQLIERFGLNPSVERSIVGFMGCYAAFNALKLARHIVRSEEKSRVLVLNLELCTLHLQETGELEQVLSFLVFGDGCAASIISADETGLALDRFRTVLVPGTQDLITWRIRESGFDMFLSGRVPGAVGQGLRDCAAEVLDGASPEDFDLWAIHPGGRSVLDSVENALGLSSAAMATSRAVLGASGNMSSATVMFVLEALMRQGTRGARGCGMAFGPGLTAETLLFHSAG